MFVMMKAKKHSILFVCLGNICRSPTAELVFSAQVTAQNKQHQFIIDSAGTSAQHKHSPPDERSLGELKANGYHIFETKSRPVAIDDFYKFDYILAMDHSNLQHLKALKPEDSNSEVKLLLDFVLGKENQAVPDPYYGNRQGFSQVLQLIEQATAALLAKLTADSA